MRKTILSISLVFFASVFAMQARDVKLFNEGWSFKRGPFNNSAAQLTTDHTSRGWQNVAIPHTWNAQDMQRDMVDVRGGTRYPQDRFYTGEGMYKKTYTPAASLKDKRVLLRFEGVGAVAEVYVNNKFAGRHLGAFSAFTVDISRLLKYGEENEILVKADNSARPDVIPINHVLFGVYGGIYRDVSVIVTEPISIATTDYASSGIYISQDNVTRKSANVNVKIKIDNITNTSQDIKLVTTIYEMNSTKVKDKKETLVKLTPQGRQYFNHDFNVRNPHLWQGLEDPYLYKVVTQIVTNGKVIDEVVQPLGFRHFDLKVGEGMLLNGKKVPMYGVCRHQDWWEKGSALTNVEHDTDLEIIKEMGATTIRFAHYQQAERIYAKCDSIGFIVWAEIPFVNGVSTLETENAKQQMTELIRQNYNHPSIYTWGLHNEVYTPFEQTIPLTETLHDLSKSEDPYRYTVSVSGYNEVDRPANNHADILGINHYFGWYGGRMGDVVDWTKKIAKDFPEHKVIFSEYGGEANIYHQKETVTDIGDCCGFTKNYNETWGTKFHEINWGAIANSNYLLASYVWNTFDFATPMAAQGGVHSRNMKGLVTFDRKTKKDPFYWYKANWSKEPVVYITQRRVVNRGNEHTPVTVYSNVGVPLLIVNGKEYTEYSKGTTDVHYIFNSVQLTKGENKVEAKGTRDGTAYSDKIVWNYSEEYKGEANAIDPELKTKQHIGL